MYIQSRVLCSLNSVNPVSCPQSEDTSVSSVFAAKADFHSVLAEQVAKASSSEKPSLVCVLLLLLLLSEQRKFILLQDN